MKTKTNLSDQDSESFRLFLQEELTRRCAKNPRYSLRTFAKVLDIQAPTLSHILRGQRKITSQLQQNLAKALDLSDKDLKQIRKQNQARHKDHEDYMQLQKDQFALISEWYYFAILELLQVDGFQKNNRWIAKSLGLSISEVNIAMERLFRLKLIEVHDDGSWTAKSAHTTLGTEKTSQALRQLQKKFLEKSMDALNQVDVKLRDHSGITMSIDTSDIPSIKEKIQKFRRELCEFAERHPGRQQVYQLSISFFPLSQVEEKTETFILDSNLLSKEKFL